MARLGMSSRPRSCSRTYGGEMVVVHEGDMTLVADRPHVLDELNHRQHAS